MNSRKWLSIFKFLNLKKKKNFFFFNFFFKKNLVVNWQSYHAEMIDHAEMTFPHDHSVVWQLFQFCKGIWEWNLQIEPNMSFKAPNFTKIDAQWSRIVVFHQINIYFWQLITIFDEFTSEDICQFIQIQFSTAFSTSFDS